MEASKNSSIGLNTLYPACGAIDSEDRFITPGFIPSSGTNGQAAQIRGQLILCPDHPHADAWKNSLANADAVIVRETADAELEAAGLKFGAGTVLVGSEVKPGTYISEGTIKDCYWARRDAAGGVIENQFIPSARRVEVTIKASDYAFDSSSCGQWRAAR